MKKLLLLLLLPISAFADMNVLREYATATTIDFCLPMYSEVRDFEPAATFATGDVTVMKDEGTEDNIGTLPTDEGNCYSLPLTGAEMTAARITVRIEDLTATKIWMDTVIYVDSYGNASAEHPDIGEISTATFAAGAIDAAAIAADAIGASEIAADAIGASEMAANAIGPSEVANDTIDALAIATDAIDADALAADAVDEIWDEVIETAGATYTARCITAIQAAYVAGAFNTVGNTTTYKDTSDTSTRVVGTVTATGRDTMSITCP